MLRVIFFDVGHGDSIVVENTALRKFAAVDSHLNLSRGEQTSRVYDYLKKAGAQELDAVVVTHLHRDHFTGIEQLLQNFGVKRLLIPPFLSRNDKIHNQILHNTANKVREVIRRASDPYVVKPSLSLAYLLNFITNNEHVVEEATGPTNQKTICGVDCTVNLPLPRVKGQLHHKLATAPGCLDTFSEMNDASIALTVNYAGKKILLTGDSPPDQWNEHKRQRARDGETNLSGSVLKVSHHGSRHNNNTAVFSYLLDSTLEPISIVSANGRTHPHDEYFELVNQFNLKPYCTGLAEQCKPKNVRRLTSLSAVPKDARVFIDSMDAEGASVSCQGDITLEVEDDGTCSVKTSVGLPCIYRM